MICRRGWWGREAGGKKIHNFPKFKKYYYNNTTNNLLMMMISLMISFMISGRVGGRRGWWGSEAGGKKKQVGRAGKNPKITGWEGGKTFQTQEAGRAGARAGNFPRFT